jgi:hypothetical protein
MSLIQFSNARFYERTFNLGDDLVFIRGNKVHLNCRFVKVTRKGFNILDLDTNRCLLQKHLYGKGMGNKEYAKNGPIKVKVMLSEWVTVQVKPSTRDNVG